MENGREITAEQMLQINKMLNKANFELNRKENLGCNITRVSEKEIWKNIGEVEGYEQYSDYEVSTFGRVKSLKFGREKILKLPSDQDGYLHVGLRFDFKRSSFLVSRLVAAAFCENDNPNEKIQANHINHRKSDNYYRNLEWVSPSENQKKFYDYDIDIARKRKEVISKANKGRPKSDEARKKMSESKQKISEELSRRMTGENNPMFGKFGAAHPNFGKKMSDETRKKLSESQKARHAAKKSQ